MLALRDMVEVHREQDPCWHCLRYQSGSGRSRATLSRLFNGARKLGPRSLIRIKHYDILEIRLKSTLTLTMAAYLTDTKER